MIPPHGTNLPERFWSKVKVNTDTGCWEWQAFTNKLGYGCFRYDGRWQLAHRVSYGPVPKGMELDHLCRTPACINTAHLEAVTHRENILRGKTRRRDYMKRCIRGHTVNPKNTYWITPGHYICNACRRVGGKLEASTDEATK